MPLPETALQQRLRGLKSLVGNTPLLAIDLKYRGQPRVIYAKAENLNMTGSIKDRMVLEILEHAYEGGELQPGAPIFEATSGNTGISIAALGRALGHPVTIFMPDWMSEERKNLIRSFGATIELISKEEGGFLGAIDRCATAAASVPESFLPSQFSNPFNVRAHEETTGPEIWWQLQFRGIQPSSFVAGVGTGGTVMGVGRFLKKVAPTTGLHPLEPADSPTLSTGCKVGKHRIQGISDEFIPSICELDELDEIVSIHDGDAILMAQKLAAQLGIGVGISSGANFLGALRVQNESGGNAPVATVFPDDNKKYLSTDLLRNEPVGEDFLSPDVELVGFRSFKRVCYTCCDPSDCLADEVGLVEGIELPPCPRRG